MKYFLIVFDGMADEPIPDLDNRTPMQVARKPYMDSIAQQGLVGSAVTTPQGMSPGSDVTNMGILGYDPHTYYRGRAAIEAASLQIPMESTDVAFRANLVSTDGEKMLDSSAGHVTTEEARELIALIDQKLSTRTLKFYPGVSYRHILIWRNGSDNVELMPPYKFHGKEFREYLPNGDGDDTLTRIIEDSYEILNDHPVNRRRRDEGHLPANMLWFWGAGRMPEIPLFFREFGKTGAVVAAVDLIKGLGRMVGLKVLDVPGATGYVDTNYLGKGQYATAVAADVDFVWVHVEAADEAGHENDIEKKIVAIEQMDKLVLGTILDWTRKTEQDVRILLLPDHPTPIATGSHSAEPVPFILYDSRNPQRTSLPFDERAVPETNLRVEFTPDLMKMLLEQK